MVKINKKIYSAVSILSSLLFINNKSINNKRSIEDDNSKSWSELDSTRQKYWSILGWNNDSWNKIEPPESDNKSWATLTYRERAAARRLGYNKESWNNKESDIELKESKKPIIIPTHNWSSQIVMAYVIGGIFKYMGLNVEYVSTNATDVYESIRVGDITLSHEIWEIYYPFNNAKDKGGLLDWGYHVAKNTVDIGYPNWVAELKGIKGKGLPIWRALNDPELYKKFISPSSDGKGLILVNEYEGNYFEQLITDLNLNDKWVVKYAAGFNDLWKELKSAKIAKRGVIIFNWSPNFTDAAGFTFINFPFPYKEGYLKKAINENFPKTHPNAAKMFKKLSFTTSQIGKMASLVDIDNMSYQDAANKWLKDNKKVWTKFLE